MSATNPSNQKSTEELAHITVREIREALALYPDDAKVLIRVPYGTTVARPRRFVPTSVMLVYLECE